jgi:hypothetical protein
MVARLTQLGISKDVLLDVAEDHDIKDFDAAAAHPTYELRERSLYRVGTDFPRIIASSFVGGGLPEKVLDITYGIDLSSQIPLDDASSTRAVRSLALGLP